MDFDFSFVMVIPSLDPGGMGRFPSLSAGKSGRGPSLPERREPFPRDRAHLSVELGVSRTSIPAGMKVNKFAKECNRFPASDPQWVDICAAISLSSLAQTRAVMRLGSIRGLYSTRSAPTIGLLIRWMMESACRVLNPPGSG